MLDPRNDPNFQKSLQDSLDQSANHDARTVDTTRSAIGRQSWSAIAWGPNDPPFPQTAMGLDARGGFAAIGLARECWSTSEPIRAIFRRAFATALLPYHNPHSLRAMMVRHVMSLDLTPEEVKAWSQNIGHSDPLTTFASHGQVPTHRQGELIQARATERIPMRKDDPALRAALATIVARLS